MAPAAVTPEGLATLEAERSQRPGDVAIVTRTGLAYYQAGQYQLARDILAMALTLDPGGFAAALHLGLAHERLGDLTAARAAYRQAGAMRISRLQRAEVDDRLTVLSRMEFAAEARLAVARERELAVVAPVANTVAVLPFRYTGVDESLRPLERGLTHLVVTDLAKVGRLTLVERERVQAIVTELGMARNGQVDPAGAARSGRLLGAAHVVQGSVHETTDRGTIRLDATVVNTTDGGVGASGSGTERLQRLFDLEKQIVFALLDQLGVVPTPAERRAIGERPTADLQAFLAFSRGLEAEDRGDFAAARQLFDAASGYDAGFNDARMRVAEVQRMSAALRTAMSGVAPSTGDQLARRVTDPQRTRGRAQVQEGLNRDDPTLIGVIGTIVIVVPRP